MKTSTIRHPKFSHKLDVHSWQVKACGGNIYAALLLSYLENKFNLLQELKEKNGGWMKLIAFQLKNGIFAETFSQMEEALTLLEELNYIDVLTKEEEPSLNDGEFMVKFHASRINKHLEDGTLGSRQNDINPMLVFSLISLNCNLQQEVLTPPTSVEQMSLIDVGPEPNGVKDKWRKNDSETKIGLARNLFDFWKCVHEHPRSNMQVNVAKKIIDRLGDGYHPEEIAHGVIGLLYSDYHKTNSYDHMEYVVRDGSKLDRLRKFAESKKIFIIEAAVEYNEFLKCKDAGVKYTPKYTANKSAVNPITGNTLK